MGERLKDQKYVDTGVIIAGVPYIWTICSNCERDVQIPKWVLDKNSEFLCYECV